MGEYFKVINTKIRRFHISICFVTDSPLKNGSSGTDCTPLAAVWVYVSFYLWQDLLHFSHFCCPLGACRYLRCNLWFKANEVMCLENLNDSQAIFPFSRIAWRGEEDSRNYKLGELISPEKKANHNCWTHIVLSIEKKAGGGCIGLPRADSVRFTFPFSIELLYGDIVSVF